MNTDKNITEIIYVNRLKIMNEMDIRFMNFKSIFFLCLTFSRDARRVAQGCLICFDAQYSEWYRTYILLC